MLRFLLIAASATAMVGLFSTASAMTAVQTVERMVVETLEDGSQRVSYVEVSRVKPGEEVIYRLSFENDLDEAAANVALTMPVPADVLFVEGSAEEPGTVVTYSADGGETFSDFVDMSATDVTHIRWTFDDDIAANSKGDILFRAILK